MARKKYEIFKSLGSTPTVTFGCSTPEIVGPLKPRNVQYGVTYGSDNGGNVFMGHGFPTTWLNFNKYRPDLPPWEQVVEMVFATQTESGVYEATFIDTETVGTDITGDLKTVNVVADDIFEGVEAAAIIERDEVAEKRGMTESNINSGSEFKVTEDLR